MRDQFHLILILFMPWSVLSHPWRQNRDLNVKDSRQTLTLGFKESSICEDIKNFVRLPSEDSCLMYYQCYSGAAYLLQCPENTWFNREEEICDDDTPPEGCDLTPEEPPVDFPDSSEEDPGQPDEIPDFEDDLPEENDDSGSGLDLPEGDGSLFEDNSSGFDDNDFGIDFHEGHDEIPDDINEDEQSFMEETNEPEPVPILDEEHELPLPDESLNDKLPAVDEFFGGDDGSGSGGFENELTKLKVFLLNELGSGDGSLLEPFGDGGLNKPSIEPIFVNEEGSGSILN